MSHFFSRVSSRRPLRDTASRKLPRQRRRRMFFEALEDRRMLAAGDLDPTFGVGGKVTTDFGIVVRLRLQHGAAERRQDRGGRGHVQRQ